MKRWDAECEPEPNKRYCYNNPYKDFAIPSSKNIQIQSH